jgi:hypothetical protein
MKTLHEITVEALELLRASEPDTFLSRQLYPLIVPSHEE